MSPNPRLPLPTGRRWSAAHKYHAEVLLPQHARKEGIQSSYNNGVLELKLAVSKGD